jgi:hypothetical protein
MNDSLIQDMYDLDNTAQRGRHAALLKQKSWDTHHGKQIRFNFFIHQFIKCFITSWMQESAARLLMLVIKLERLRSGQAFLASAKKILSPASSCK